MDVSLFSTAMILIAYLLGRVHGEEAGWRARDRMPASPARGATAITDMLRKHPFARLHLPAAGPLTILHHELRDGRLSPAGRWDIPLGAAAVCEALAVHATLPDTDITVFCATTATRALLPFPSIDELCPLHTPPDHPDALTPPPAGSAPSGRAPTPPPATMRS